MKITWKLMTRFGTKVHSTYNNVKLIDDNMSTAILLI